MKKFKLVAAVLLVLSGAYGTQAMAYAYGCGQDAKFQIGNKTGSTFTVGAVSGSIPTQTNVKVGTMDFNPMHIATLPSSCQTGSCTINVSNLSVPANPSKNTSACILNGSMTVETVANEPGSFGKTSCQVTQAYFSSAGGGGTGISACGYTACIETGADHSYPTLMVCPPDQKCPCSN